MEVIQGRHTSHFQSVSSRTEDEGTGSEGATCRDDNALEEIPQFSLYQKKKLYVARIGLTSKK